MYRSSRGKKARSRVVVSGGGRELRVDGTFASFYTPGQVTRGSVWDALGASVLALPSARRRRVLVLGLGGGSVARLVRALAPRAQIVGVEIDPEVVALARRWFDLDDLRVELVVDDARHFLARERRRFDAVIEDVFVGRGRAVHKPAWMIDEGLPQAAERVADGGILTSNTLDETAEVAAVLRARFPGLVEIGVSDYDNRVLVAGRGSLSGRALRNAVAATPELAGSVRALQFRKR
ncbi:MAG: spermidine synthase [Myxococcota bacterium]